MPLYEFECSCGHREEVFFHGVTEQRMIDCPACGEPAFRVVSRCVCKVWRYDSEWAGTPQHAEANAKRCGVPT